jgi:hypothetical protein
MHAGSRESSPGDARADANKIVELETRFKV